MLKEALQILIIASKPNKIISRDTVIFSKLMTILDHPHKHFKCIHVTGTNGKGSVTLKTASVLEQAGLKVGMYTSPHIFSFLERIQVNRQNINESYFGEKILMLHDIKNKHQLEITFFEYLTALSFLYFKDSKCDVAAIEVGLGGRFDTTNVIDPVLSIITSIGLDHEKLLGDTVEKIAYDKAGIIKRNRPVVIGPKAHFQCIIDQANLMNSPLIAVPPTSISDFEQENNLVVKTAIEQLISQGFNVSQAQIEQGLKIKQPCRMQYLPKELIPKYCQAKQIIFDVGHNPSAIKQMMKYYLKNVKRGNDKLCVVFGASREKKVTESLKEMEEVADLIYLIEAKHERAMKVSQLSQYLGISKYPGKFKMLSDGDIKATLDFATADSTCQNLIICGSFFLMPEAWGYFDPKYLPSSLSFQESYEMKSGQKM